MKYHRLFVVAAVAATLTVAVPAQGQDSSSGICDDGVVCHAIEVCPPLCDSSGVPTPPAESSSVRCDSSAGCPALPPSPPTPAVVTAAATAVAVFPRFAG